MKILEISFLVPYKYKGFRLDNFLSNFFPMFTRVFYRNLILSGFLFVNSNKCFFPDFILNDSDKLVIFLNKRFIHLNKSIYLSIIYKDNNFIIFNKSYDFVMFPSKKYLITSFFNTLLKINVNLYTLPRFGIVHRLDKDTTGLFIVACNLISYYSFIRQFKTRLIKRIYEAVVFGFFFKDGKINIPLKGSRYKMVPNLNGRKALTFFHILKVFKDFMHLKINLFTGRKHQIRSHLNYIGHSIIGDKLYLNKSFISKDYKFIEEFSRQALHAKEINFFYPLFNKRFICKIHLPNDINNLLNKLSKL